MRIKKALPVRAIVVLASVGTALVVSMPAVAAPHLSGRGPAATTAGRVLAVSPAAWSKALKSGHWTLTPDGLFYRSCVYRVPAGAVVGSNEITLASGARRHIRPCAHPRLVQAQQPSSVASGQPRSVAPANSCEAGNTNWWAEVCWNAPSPLDFLQANFGVSTNPSNDGALIGYFPAFQNAAQTSILQPLLVWGADPGVQNNPNIWWIASMYVSPEGNGMFGQPFHVGAGDTITGDIEGVNCNSRGVCDWTILTNGNGFQSMLNVTGTVAYTMVNAVMEVRVWGGNCNEMPPGNQAAYRNILVENTNGQFVSP